MVVGQDFLFIHVPKVAGNAIRQALFPAEIYKPNHCPLFQVPAKFRDRFTFGFVRNPWDRVCSLYHFRAQSGICAREQELKRLNEDGFEKSLLGQGIGPNQQDAMYWLEGCDYIGMYESLQDDFNHVCNVIGVEQVKLDRINPSVHDDYRSYYTQEMIDFVAEKHKRTIELFDYTF